MGNVSIGIHCLSVSEMARKTGWEGDCEKRLRKGERITVCFLLLVVSFPQSCQKQRQWVMTLTGRLSESEGGWGVAWDWMEGTWGLICCFDKVRSIMGCRQGEEKAPLINGALSKAGREIAVYRCHPFHF